MVRAGFSALVALTLCGCGPADGPTKIAIVGARLVDGKGGDPIEHSIILIEGATVVKTGSQSSVPLPKGAEVVNGMGKTIEPVPGRTIEPGQAADLMMKSDGSVRTMKDGQWRN